MPDSVILGKAATAHILGKTGTELPDRQVIDIGVGFDFTTIEEGGIIFFDDPLQHIPVYQVGELAGNALKRLDIAILSIPVGDSTGWYREDIGRRFAATLAAFVEYKGAEGQSIAVVFLGRTDEIRAALAAKVQDHPELADSGNPAPLQARIRALLGLPSVFASQFAEMCRFLEIKTLTDAGCGDFGWMQTLSERFSLKIRPFAWTI